GAIGGGVVSACGDRFPLLGLVPAVAGVVGAISAAIGADADVYSHRVAGNVLTQVRHTARVLRTVEATDMSARKLKERVLAMSQRYNATIQGLPVTDDEAMEKVRIRVRGGTFHPDFLEAEEMVAKLPLRSEPE
ncbi:MAG: hypothetical protein AAFN41_11810, partial [Planctomycetota bacterium]